MRSTLLSLAVAAISAIAFAGNAHAEEKAVPLDKLPKAVTDAVKKMFPHAEMLKASQEKEEEEDEIEYEVTIKENGAKIDVTVEEDGEIETLEKEIDIKDLPKAVSKALSKAHAGATLKSAEAVYEVEDGEQELEFYEVQLTTADGKQIEAKLKPSGKVAQDDDEDDQHGEEEDDD